MNLLSNNVNVFNIFSGFDVLFRHRYGIYYDILVWFKKKASKFKWLRRTSYSSGSFNTIIYESHEVHWLDIVNSMYSLQTTVVTFMLVNDEVQFDYIKNFYADCSLLLFGKINVVLSLTICNENVIYTQHIFLLCIFILWSVCPVCFHFEYDLYEYNILVQIILYEARLVLT